MPRRRPAPNEVQLEAGRRGGAEKIERRPRARLQRSRRRRHAPPHCARRRGQIIEDKKLPRAGEIEYRFSADGAIRTLLVNEAHRKQLASGALVIARLGERYELLPRAAGEKVRERAAGMIVLDHAAGSGTASTAANAEDDAYYAQFQVPDDLVW